jgi:hypothetical protein
MLPTDCSSIATSSARVPSAALNPSQVAFATSYTIPTSASPVAGLLPPKSSCLPPGNSTDAGAALQFGVNPARRLELEAAGGGAGDRRAVAAATRQQVTGPPGLVIRVM